MSITIHGIDNLDAAETLRNLANGSKIARLSLRDMLYRIQLENKSPLFLQLSQHASGEVDAIIPNTPEAELMAEWMNVQIMAGVISTGSLLTQEERGSTESYPIKRSTK